MTSPDDFSIDERISAMLLALGEPETVRQMVSSLWGRGLKGRFTADVPVIRAHMPRYGGIEEKEVERAEGLLTAENNLRDKHQIYIIEAVASSRRWKKVLRRARTVEEADRGNLVLLAVDDPAIIAEAERQGFASAYFRALARHMGGEHKICYQLAGVTPITS